MSGLSNTYSVPNGMLCYSNLVVVLGWSWKWSILSGWVSLVGYGILGMDGPGMIQMVP